MSHESRQWNRHLHEAKAILTLKESGREFVGVSRDLSVGGAFIETHIHQPATPSAEAGKLQIFLSNEKVEIPCEVIDEVENGFTLKFHPDNALEFAQRLDRVEGVREHWE